MEALKGAIVSGKFRFMDNAGKVVYEYNPTNISGATTSYQLGENEELIGVYGVYGVREHYYWISSFGFIVKVKANN